jgi:hypothetical protein
MENKSHSDLILELSIKFQILRAKMETMEELLTIMEAEMKMLRETRNESKGLLESISPSKAENNQTLQGQS